MLQYLVRYDDGYEIGAAGDVPHTAIAAASAATGRPESEIDTIIEHGSRFTIYDRAKGWLAPRFQERTEIGEQLVDVNTGLLVVSGSQPGADDPDA